MQTLRNTVQIARLVLVWFVLSIGVAVASPAVNPKTMELVCSASGSAKLVVQGEDGSASASSHLLDCPLCAAVGAPPPVAINTALSQPSPLSHALLPIEVARIASATAPPLPSRGPPTSVR